MTPLDNDDLRKLSELLLDLYSPGDLSSFRRRTTKNLQRVFGGEMVCHNEIDLQTGESLSVLARPIAGFDTLRDAFFVHVHEHPSIQHLLAADGTETTAVKTSDFVTQRQWRNTGLYREFYRELDDIRYQLTIGHKVEHRLLFLAVSRTSGDFTESERALLSMLRPHFIQAYDNARAYSAAQTNGPDGRDSGNGFTAAADAWVVCSYAGRILKGSEGAWQMLERWFPEEAIAADRLPAPLRAWLGRTLGDAARVSDPRVPFHLVDQRGEITVRGYADLASETYELRFFERPVADGIGVMRRALGLSRRETDVLRWLMNGKTNDEIAQILGISRSTVKTHVSSILSRLEVDTRAGAVSRAMELARFRPVIAPA